jgi:hypothetical protein
MNLLEPTFCVVIAILQCHSNSFCSSNKNESEASTSSLSGDAFRINSSNDCKFGSSGLDHTFEGLLLGASQRCHESNWQWLFPRVGRPLTKGTQGSLRPHVGMIFLFCRGLEFLLGHKTEVSEHH